MTTRVAARVFAQAKINLFLRVLARETSGYHQLATLYCRIASGDDVIVRVDTSDRTLQCSGEAMPQEGLGPTENNLAWRAAMAFRSATGWPEGFAIEITKRIPVGGGLGGGSADAGAVLRALNALAPQPMGPNQLLEVAGSIGSDVPFQTQDESTLAFGWGRGDQMLTLPALPERHVMLFTFGHGVPTKDAYQWIARTPPPKGTSAMFRHEDLSNWGGVAALAHNDFEGVVLPRFRLIELTLAGARKGAAGGHFGPQAVAALSGSGSTVFLIHDPDPERKSNWMFPLSAGVKVHLTTTSTRVEPVELID